MSLAITKQKMTSLDFPKTYTALNDFKNQFNCCSCGVFASNPCTLGGCEHIFCSECCDANLEKNECPVCFLHVNVKDAQVNRQIFNLVKLCQRLEAVITDQDEGQGIVPAVSREANEATEISRTHWSPPKCTEQNKTDRKTRRSSLSHNGYNPISSDNSTQKQSIKRVISPSKENDSTPTVKNRGQKRSSLPCDQRTMTQMFDEMEYSDDEEIVKENGSSPKTLRKGKRGKRLVKSGTKPGQGHVSIDQTTMSQFFDYVDESEGESEKSLKCYEEGGKLDRQSLNPRKRGSSRNLRIREKNNSSKLNSSLPCLETPPQKGNSGRGCNSASRVDRVSALRENEVSQKKVKRSLSPKTLTPVSKVKANTSLTGSGKKGVDPLLKKNAKGETTLQVAAIKGDIKKVEELLTAGANPNTRDNAGWTPLHEAVHHGHIQIARLLINHGAMINVPGTENDTPLHDAIRQGQIECVKLLVSHGALLSSRNIHGLTPVDMAITDEMKNALKEDKTNVTEPVIENVDVLEFQQPCLLPTALTRDQKRTLQKCATIIQATVVEDYSAEVTHVVTSCNTDGMCPRTFKYMQGVMNGRWIVNFSWIEMCVEYGSRVCEEAFEVPGTSQNIESHAAEKGRVNRKKQLPKLFEGYQFYFQGSFEYPTPNKDDLVDLVRSGGGQILAREPKSGHALMDTDTVPYHAPPTGPLKECCIFIVHDNKAEIEPIRTQKICSVSVAWLLDCVGTFQIQPVIE